MTRLTDRDANVHARDAEGRTSLHHAAARADRAALRDLLARGADPIALDARSGASPLHHAAQSGHPGVVRDLLDVGAFINLAAPHNGVTPLMAATWFRRPDVVALLLEHPDVDVERRSAFGATAEEIIGYGDSPGAAVHPLDREMRRLFAVHRTRHVARCAAQPLLGVLTDPELAPDERAQGVRDLLAGPVVCAIDDRSPATGSGTDGHTALLVAARDGNIGAVAALLAAGADQTVTDGYMGAVPAHKAAYGGHTEVLRLLAAAPRFAAVRDAQGPYNGYTPLHDAAWHGHRGAAEVLLAEGARTDLTGLDGRTAAELADDNGYCGLACRLRLLGPACEVGAVRPPSR